ncbi:MAG: DsbC family protein, partial [Candidatus Dadabacteria bacterium]|nr:DsbC family protein [Candidatus Dadabacteria bacterium]
MKLVNIICVLFTLLCSLNLYADEKVEQNIKKSLTSFLPDVEITRISKTPIANLYEVLVGTNIIYMTGDGRYVLKGDLLDMQKKLNLSESKR